MGSAMVLVLSLLDLGSSEGMVGRAGCCDSG